MPKKAGGGFFTVAGFNGDSITTKKKETARDFALYLIAQYHAKEIRDVCNRNQSAGAAALLPSGCCPTD
jgi:hypothetical protein